MLSTSTLQAVLAAYADPAAVATVTVNTSKTTHQVDPMFMGCHSDSGFAHTERNFYSQMICAFVTVCEQRRAPPSLLPFPATSRTSRTTTTRARRPATGRATV